MAKASSVVQPVDSAEFFEDVHGQMLDHPLTTAGAAKFKADWESRPEFAEWLGGLVAARAARAASR